MASSTRKLAKWTLALHGKYIPSGIFDAQFVGPEQPGYSPTLASSVSSNTVAGAFYLDLSRDLSRARQP